MQPLPELLPSSYNFVDQETIKPEEIVRLRSSANWGTETDLGVWQKVLNDSLATVGVRHENNALVGVGFLAGNIRQAILCDLVVAPDHRSKGIGKEIVNRRLNIADRLGIRYLYVDLAPTNTLASYYGDLGFVVAGQTICRTIHPQPKK